MSPKTLFLIGPGFIGGSLLVRLKEVRPDLKLTALTRREEQASELAQLGIEPIKGSLDDSDIIAKHAGLADIVIHAATADHAESAFAVVRGIKERSDKTRKVVYIHTSGTDELLGSAQGMRIKSDEERMLTDVKGDGWLASRLLPDAPHRQVDGPLLQMLLNEKEEEKHNVSASIMMPPLIYGISSKPWSRLSIQVPMLARSMMESGIVTFPHHVRTGWNAVWVHDLVEAYVLLLADLESHSPGSVQPSHYAFPAEPRPVLWNDILAAIVKELKEAGHPAAKGEPKELDEEAFYQFIGGKSNPYAPFFNDLVFGMDNSYSSSDRLQQLGLRHRGKGVMDSILNGKELDDVITSRV